jgi:hypothetical protein
LCIDDEEEEKVEGVLRNLLTRPTDLFIEHQRAKGWNEQIDYIKTYQSTTEPLTDKWDGILMDLKLEFPISENATDRLVYGASALAQEIRSLVKKGDLVDTPILLYSTDENFMTYFDKTGTDLFDACFKKNDIVVNDSKIDFFIAHAIAYQKIIENTNDIVSLLQSPNSDYAKEVNSYFEKLKTVHEKASFIYNQVVQPTGLLIDEDTLAIRLGIDRTRSNEWEQVKTHFEAFRYKGIYAEITPKWWMTGLNKWWKTNFVALSIQNTSAEKKVESLKAHLRLNNLAVITKPEHHQYDLYWHKCIKSSLPTATADGLRCFEEPRYTWQTPQYVSLNYVWNSTLRDEGELRKTFSTTELEKFEKIIQERNTNH